MPTVTRFDAAQCLQDIYATEAHFALMVLWDGGWDVFYGAPVGDWFTRFCDHALKYDEAAGNFATFVEAVEWLARSVIAGSPKSEFAAKWRSVLEM